MLFLIYLKTKINFCKYDNESISDSMHNYNEYITQVTLHKQASFKGSIINSGLTLYILNFSEGT